MIETIDEKHTLCGCSMADYLERKDYIYMYEPILGYQMTQVSQTL